jgi:taurine transport system substrate-binding protein
MRKPLMVLGVMGIMVFMAAIIALETAAADGSAATVRVAYHAGWPGTFGVGWARGLFEKEMGARLDWKAYDTGRQMCNGLAANDIDMAYALGSVPFALAVTNGFRLKLVAISETYSDAENLVVRDDSGINKPRDLVGKRVGTPFGTTAHYRLMGILQMFGVDAKKVTLIDMPGSVAVKAFIEGEIDAACVWEPALFRMIQSGGRIIVSAREILQAGYDTYGVVAVSLRFFHNHPDLIRGFVKALDRSTAFYRSHPHEAYPLIAEKAGLTSQKANEIMASMEFFLKEEQLSPAWLGSSTAKGRVAQNLKQVAAFFFQEKMVERVLDDYSSYIEPIFLEQIE